jgi:uncharacterized membrane protein
MQIFFVRAWDLLFWITIFFPFFTGGVWWKAPDFRIELTQINIQVITLGFLGLLLEWKNPGSISRTSSIRILKKAWESWRNILKNKPHQSLWLATLLLAPLWAAAAISRHRGFETSNADLGIFTNGIWNFTNGNGFVSSMKSGANLLTDHQSPLFMLFGPIFWLVQSPETLLAMQALGLLTGGVALYWLARQYLPQGHAAIDWLPIAYWFFFPTRNANRFDFHPEVMMLPLFLWAIVGLQSKTNRARVAGGLAFLLALGAKESAGPVAVGICLAWFAGAAPEASRRFTRIFAMFALPTSTALFIFNTTVVPGLFGKKYTYEAVYSHLGGKTSQIILAPFRDPLLFLRALTEEGRVKLFLASLAPVMLLPLLNPRTFIASLPGYLMILLTLGSHRISLGYHYSIEFSIGLFWALPGAILSLEKWRPAFAFSNPRTIAIAAIFLFGSYGRSDPYYIRSYPITEHQKWVRSEVFPCISQESISVPDSYAPHLSLRPWAHFLPILEKPENSGNFVSCVMTDETQPLGLEQVALMKKHMDLVGYQEVFSCQGLKIYASSRGNPQCLSCTPKCQN